MVKIMPYASVVILFLKQGENSENYLIGGSVWGSAGATTPAKFKVMILLFKNPYQNKWSDFILMYILRLWELLTRCWGVCKPQITYTWFQG